MAAVPSIGRAARVEGGPAPEADLTRALYEQYANPIFRYCLHQLGSREEAEDAVQSTFLNAFRGIKRGVVPELESAWLFKIAHNVCLSRRRTSWRRGRIESPTDFDIVEELTPAPSQRSDELIGLQDVLEQLPENQRRAILLREWQGLSYREISEELDLSQAAVETLIFRARRALASGLEQPPVAKRRVARGADLGNVLAGLKSLLLGGGAAVKVAATVAVVSASTVVAAAPIQQHRAHVHAAPKPSAAAPASRSASAQGSAVARVARPETTFPAKGGAPHRARAHLQTSAASALAQMSSAAMGGPAARVTPSEPAAVGPPAAEPAAAPAPPASEPAPAEPAAPATVPVEKPASEKPETKKAATPAPAGTTQTGQKSSGSGSTSSEWQQRVSSSGIGAPATPTPVTMPVIDGTQVVQTETTSQMTTTTNPFATTPSSTSPSGLSQGNAAKVPTPVRAVPPVIVPAATPTPALTPALTPPALAPGSPRTGGNDSKRAVPTPVVAAPATVIQPAPVSRPAVGISSGSTSIPMVINSPWKTGGVN